MPVDAVFSAFLIAIEQRPIGPTRSLKQLKRESVFASYFHLMLFGSMPTGSLEWSCFSPIWARLPLGLRGEVARGCITGVDHRSSRIGWERASDVREDRSTGFSAFWHHLFLPGE
jgi:hypothetical protein